jgi:hypothetical protein
MLALFSGYEVPQVGSQKVYATGFLSILDSCAIYILP